MTELGGKVALVTGGSVGIGRSIALRLAESGARLALTYLSHEPDPAFVSDLTRRGGEEPLVARVDVTDQDAVAALVQAIGTRFGGLDILVNNAGGLLARRAIADMELELWRSVINLNLDSVFLVAHEALKILRDGGRVVNIASLAGHTGGSGGATAYAAAKSGVFGFTRGLAKELGPRGITVNAVAPGLILDTPFHATFTPPEAQQATIASTPLQRAGIPVDVADPVVWLCSDASSFVSGAVIDINGAQYFA